jgi:restriction endonuclease S subunit
LILKIKLAKLTEIRSGLVLSRNKSSLQSIFKKTYNVISLKSFNENGIYNHSFVEKFEFNSDIKEDYLIKKDDVILRLREPNIAVYIHKDYPNTIVSSLAIIIRVKDKSKLNPIYLTHYLNSSIVKKQLQKELSGTSISMVKVIDIQNINIDIPLKDIQDKLSSQQQLAIKEIELLNQLIQQKQQYRKSIFETKLKEIS